MIKVHEKQSILRLCIDSCFCASRIDIEISYSVSRVTRSLEGKPATTSTAGYTSQPKQLWRPWKKP